VGTTEEIQTSLVLGLAATDRFSAQPARAEAAEAELPFRSGPDMGSFPAELALKTILCRLSGRLLDPRSKVFVILDAAPRAQKKKSRMIAPTAGWKDFPLDANDFVRSYVGGIVNNPVDPGSQDFVSRPVNFRFVDR